jgi:cell shape-determining protein MreD
MNWPVVLFVTYVLLGLELAVRPALALGSSGIAPSFLLPLVVYIATHAPAMVSLWFALALGLLLDLLGPYNAADARATITVVGPNALGYVAAAYTVLTLRGVMVRNNRLTLMVLSVVAGMVVAVTCAGVVTFRSLYDSDLVVSPSGMLLSGVGSAVYTAASSFVLAMILTPMGPLLGFADQHRRRGRTG